jgi:hypothetical protein
MPMYTYEEFRPKVLEPEGQKKLLTVHRHVLDNFNDGRPFEMQAAMKPIYGDTWTNIAVVEYLVEMGVLREIKTMEETATQHRLFKVVT